MVVHGAQYRLVGAEWIKHTWNLLCRICGESGSWIFGLNKYLDFPRKHSIHMNMDHFPFCTFSTVAVEYGIGHQVVC